MVVSKSRNQIAFLIAMLSILSWSQLYGQIDSTDKDNSLAEGSWALQFGISSDFALTSFKGSVLSVKYHLSERGAIRVGVSGEVIVGDNYGDRADIQLTTSYLFYSKPHEEIFLFFGAGPTVGFDWTRYEYEYSSGSTNYTEITDRSQWSVGLSAVLGVEWFATRWLSLHAEYGGSALYTRGTNKRSYKGAFRPSNDYQYVTKDWSARPTGVKFGASVYL